MNFNFLFNLLAFIFMWLTGASRFMNGFKTIMIDFDGVLFPTNGKLFETDFENNSVPYTMILFISWLYENDFKVIIHTSRVINNPLHYFKIRKYLKRYGIRFEYITAIKFPALLYVDDSAVVFSTECKGQDNKYFFHYLVEKTERTLEEKLHKRKDQWGF